MSLGKALSLLLLMLVFVSCSNNAHFESFKPIENETWNMHAVKEFPVRIDDAEANYRLIITVRNTTDYAYSNLYMFLTIIYPDQAARRDTIECMLADRSGRWLGKGFGKMRESRFLIKDQMSFPDTGNYIFTIEQAMRDEYLKGISDIGLRLEKTELQ